MFHEQPLLSKGEARDTFRKPGWVPASRLRHDRRAMPRAGDAPVSAVPLFSGAK